MSVQICEYCEGSEKTQFPKAATGDIRIDFDSGNSYEMPLLILHYIADHNYQPPTNFIGDVMNSRPVSPEAQAHTVGRISKIGFLTVHYPMGSTPPSFLSRLSTIIKKITDQETIIKDERA